MPVATKKIIKEVRSLKHKKFRDEKQAYFAEGIAITLSALEHNAPVRYVVYSPELLKSEVAYRVLSEVKHRIPCYEAGAEAFQTISGRDNPVGLGAVVGYRDISPESPELLKCSKFVCLDGVKSPGNLGTVIRAADCLGFGVLISGESTDHYHPECVKASMGALYTVPVARFDTADGLKQWCDKHGVFLVTTSSRARDDITRIAAYPRPVAALLGSEATGLSRDILESGESQVRIPMYGAATSLNLAVAAGILMYDIATKPRRKVGG